MARRGGIRFLGVYAAVDNLTQTLAREAAREVSKELAKLSPQYSGDFADNWVVRVGNTPVSATTAARKPRPKQRIARRNPKLPEVPSLFGSGTREYTIGNTMEYREIAMDLIPGRVDRAAELSAPADWYILYLSSPNGLRRAIRYAAGLPVVEDAFVNPPRRSFIGPVGRLRR